MFDTLLGLSPQAAGFGDINHPSFSSDFSGQRTTAGVNVSEESSLQYSTVFACVNVLTQAKGTLPGHVFRRTGPKDAEPVDHPLNRIYSSEANPDTTGTTFRETMLANGLLWGNQYAEIVRDENGEVSEMWNLPSKSVEIARTPSGNLTYIVDRPGTARKDVLPADKVLHIPGMSLDGVVGLSPIALNRAAVALGQACVEFGSAYFGNGAWSTGFITKGPGEKNLSAEAGKKLIDSINEKFRGPGKAFGWGLLRGDMEFNQLDMPFEDAMFLDTREFQRIEICGIFNVPPSKIQDLDKATFSNVEQQDLAWAKSTILPWCVRTEMALNKAFFSGTDLFFKFNLDGLLRGDFKSRMEGIAIGRQWGLYSINDGRAFLDLPPIDEEGGDDYMVPMNMDIVGKPRIAVIGSVAEEQPPEETEEEEQALLPAPEPVAQVDLVEAFRPAVEDAARRAVVKESKALGNALKRFEKNGNEDAFAVWSDNFYSTHGAFIRDCLLPVAVSFEKTASIGEIDIVDISMGHAEGRHAGVQALLVGNRNDMVSFSLPVDCSVSCLASSILSAFSEALNQEV